MKQFLKDYGFAIISAIVIITLVTFSSPIGSTIKKETSNLVDSFGVVSEVKMDQLDNSLWEAGKSDLAIQILGHTKYLYDVGEANLTDADIVRIGDVDCYVLEVSPDQTKAKLITKDIYDVRFDDGGHTAEEVEGHVGSGDYADKTYDYKYSTLRLWMDNFYHTNLCEDLKILPTTVAYYIQERDSSGLLIEDLDNYIEKKIVNQYVYPLDAREAINNIDNFKTDINVYSLNYFWTTAGFYVANGNLNALTIRYDGHIIDTSVDNNYIGARPVFWISLE